MRDTVPEALISWLLVQCWTITSRIVSDVVILDVAGRFEIDQDSLQDPVKTFLAEGRQHFLLNLVGVPYLGSWGITQIISAWTSIGNRGGTMGLVAPAKAARDVLESTKLDNVFAIYRNEVEALQHFAKSSRLC
jgi:stage II sporulation protein AA (anti-sigma F factor antagonist)